MLQFPTYDGPINPGMRFRHLGFDVSCEVEKVEAMHVVVRSIDTCGVKAPETMTLQEYQFRQNWKYVLPERV